uniref:EF-hand domain-containing protein n=1 Tax=Noctiluca scintillans TaxID=2966 RepID=A0A7S1AV80_NOCSC
MYVLLEGTGESPFTEGAVTVDEVKRNTINNTPVLSKRSICGLVGQMLEKALLSRPTVASVLADKWFETADGEVHTEVLEQVLSRKEKTTTYRGMLAGIAAEEDLARLRELNAIFSEVDKNNDGFLSAQEVRQALRGRWSEDKIERLIRGLSGDDNTMVSYTSFMGQLMASKESEENRLLADLFHSLDKGRGQLEKSDLREWLARPTVSPFLGNNSATVIFGELDLDGDGYVQLPEFKAALQGR